MISTHVTMVAKIDNKSTLDRLNSDPGFTIVSGGLKSTDLVLKQQGDGARISVAFETESEVRLRAFGVVVHHNLLVHINTCIGQSLLL